METDVTGPGRTGLEMLCVNGKPMKGALNYYRRLEFRTTSKFRPTTFRLLVYVPQLVKNVYVAIGDPAAIFNLSCAHHGERSTC